MDPGAIIRTGTPPMQVELKNAISGLSFEEAWNQREIVDYGGVSIPVISRENLVKNKRASGRPKDRLDLDELGDN